MEIHGNSTGIIGDSGNFETFQEYNLWAWDWSFHRPSEFVLWEYRLFKWSNSTPEVNAAGVRSEADVSARRKECGSWFPFTIPTSAESFGTSTEELFASEPTESEERSEFVLDNRVIAQEQVTDDFLQAVIRKNSNLIRETVVNWSHIWTVRSGEKAGEYKTYIPKFLRPDMLQWYHLNLRHPEIDQMYATVRQNFLWPGLQKDVTKLVQSCGTC